MLVFILCAQSTLSPVLGSSSVLQDPSKKEVHLPAERGWEARLVLENGETGVWTVKAFPVFEQYAAPEVVALDDEGRCTVLVSYSGKWTPLARVHDGAWLGGLAHGDVDPRVGGMELYTGGKKGNLYQVLSYPHGALDSRLIAYLPGREIHTVLAGELDPSNQTGELLVFTRPGGLFRVTPTGMDGRFEVQHLGDLPGRVRDALVLPSTADKTPRVVTASRDGALSLLRMTSGGPRWTLIHREEMGMGRLATGMSGKRPVLYVTLDDGRVLRLEERDAGWVPETIYAGPQGLRGVAAGTFHQDPDVESVVVFGYSGRVQLLTRGPGNDWNAETIFEDRDRGHWLSIAELDGRNGTDEILGSGYGGRVFLLSRPPGYGLSGVATDPDPIGPPAAGAMPPRVGVRASLPEMDSLSPLSYRGGFQPKTMIYETLVQRDAEGRIAPALASKWEVEDNGTVFRFELRDGARFHDGSPVDAESVRIHFKRWVGLPEHGWLGANERIQDVVVESERSLRVVLSEPYALLSDLCAINPCAIQGPGALDQEGAFVRPIGSGRFRLVGRVGEGVHRFQRNGVRPDDRCWIDVVAFDSESGAAPVQALLRGDLDLVADGWYENVPRDTLSLLRGRPGLEVFDGPGSSVWYLSFRLEGPTAERSLRRAVAIAVDRLELVTRVDHGFADPATTWAAPTIRTWPTGRAQEVDASPIGLATPLRLLVHDDVPREVALAEVLTEQLEEHGLRIEVLSKAAAEYTALLEAGAFDLRLENTWGVPYDPLISIRARFLPAPESTSVPDRGTCSVDPRLTQLIEEASRIPEEEDRERIYRAIQDLMDRECLIVPLVVPRRIGIARTSAVEPIELDHDLYRTRSEELTTRD